MACCFNDIGKQAHNEALNLNIQAPVAGKYIYRLNYLGRIIYQEQEVEEIGDDLIVPGPFNEDYTYEMKILTPDNQFLIVEDCDTFIFTTFTAIKNSCNGTDECDPDNDPTSNYPDGYAGDY